MVPRCGSLTPRLGQPSRSRPRRIAGRYFGKQRHFKRGDLAHRESEQSDGPPVLGADTLACLSGRFALRGLYLTLRRVRTAQRTVERSGPDRRRPGGAHPEGAVLIGAAVTQEQLGHASGDQFTQLPDGITMPAHWSSPNAPRYANPARTSGSATQASGFEKRRATIVQRTP